jgi:hypothetical protein
MTLTSRLKLSRREVKGLTVLALDTGFDAESLEGLRLVKAARGSGWFFDQGTLTPWVTKGVLQDGGNLVIWGELASAPEGESPAEWPLTEDYRRAFSTAWTARAAADETLGRFGPSSAVPLKTAHGWAFAFLPPDLATVLDSLHPLSERLVWEHVTHPDLRGEASWAFTSAALSLLATGPLPWLQDDEAALRQELRELKKTLRDAELPDASDAVRRLWLDSLKAVGTAAAWKAWTSAPEAAPTGSAERERQRLNLAVQRQARRKRVDFWRRRGTLVAVIAGSSAIVLAVIGTIVWNWVKPDPTDTWTPEQVVRGYYQALTDLDSQQMRKLTAFDHFHEQALNTDVDQATNLYVLKQVRTAYEKTDPILSAEVWEAQGKPAVPAGRQLYGLVGLTVAGADLAWTAHYRRWVSEGTEGNTVKVSGYDMTDKLTLVQTGRGWKISALVRDSQPLP